MQEDSYLTIEEKADGLYKEKGSKFIAYAYPVTTEEEIKNIIADLKKEYYDARHHCYAYMLGPERKIFRANDDGEPSSSAGKPILGQLLSHELTNILVVVIRYFGGTKLGVSGLIHAYKTATFDAIENASIITKTVNDIYNIHFDYLVMNDVMRVIKEEKPELVSQDFNLMCDIRLSIRKGEVERIMERFNKIETLKAEYIETI